VAIKKTKDQSEALTKVANDNLTTETIKETKEETINMEGEEIVSDNLETTIEIKTKTEIMVTTEILTTEAITMVKIDSTTIDTQEKDNKEKAKTEIPDITTDLINQITTTTTTMNQERILNSGIKSKSLSRPKILWMRIKLIIDLLNFISNSLFFCPHYKQNPDSVVS
jgi:hypothetical protein